MKIRASQARSTILATAVLTVAGIVPFSSIARARSTSASGCFLLASGEVAIDVGSRVAGDVIASQPGARVRLGRAVVLADGTTVTGDRVQLGPKASVFDVATNELKKAGGAAVRGMVSGATLPIVEPTCSASPTECGSGSTRVKRRGGPMTLPPGTYGALVLENGASVSLQSGTYHVCDLRVGRKGSIETAGAVEIDVSGEARLAPGSSLVAAAGAPLPVLKAQAIKLGRAGTYEAVMAAPEGDLDVAPGAALTGSFCAAGIDLSRRVTMECAEHGPGTTTTTVPSSTTTSSTSSTTTTSTSSSSTTSTSSSTTTSSSVPGSTSTTSSSTSSSSPSTSSSTSSSTSTSSSSTPETTTSTSTTVTTTTIPALCGNGVVDAGETCDDGNNSNNDSCPANCVIASCTPVAGTTRTATIAFAPPPGGLVAGMTLLVDYPEGKVFIPTGALGSSVFTPLRPSNVALIRGFGLGFAVRGVIGASAALDPGPLFQLKFQDCEGAVPPTAGFFGCSVIDASDPFSTPVQGVTCSVSLP